MMYSNRLVAAIKVGGRILRENKEQVAIPFGSEYTVLIKNLASVRALVRVSIDGTDATEGTWLIVPANGSLELERFIKNGNWDRGNRFKFIERTSNIENHRGIKAEDGLVRIEYKFEKVYEPSSYYPYQNSQWNYTLCNNTPNVGGGTLYRQGSTFTANSNSLNDGHETLCDSDDIGYYSYEFPVDSLELPATKSSGTKSFSSRLSKSSDGITRGRSLQANASMNCFVSQSVPTAAPVNTEGITVAGSESNQKFVTGAWFPTETQTHTMVLKLVGAIEGVTVSKPITVQYKPKCTTCGRVNKATNKFCSECGTALVLL